MMDRQEDKEVRRISKRVKLDPMIDEDSDDKEDYHTSLQDPTKPSYTPSDEQTRRSRTPVARSVAEDTEIPATQGQMGSAAAVSVSVGSALRRDADGSVVAPKVLPKRNKCAKVGPKPYLT